MEGGDYSVSGTHITIPGNGRRVEIALVEERESRIGPTIRPPSTPVNIVFPGFTETDRKRFMERFELIFRKGGG